MEEVKLDVQIRKEAGKSKVRSVRREDMIPGVVYGGDDHTMSIKMDRRSFERIRRLHHGEVIFHINVFEGDKRQNDYSAIVKEEQHDPVSDKVMHVDFKRISLKEEIEVKISLAAKGEPVGVKRDGGVLEQVIWELEIICLPMDMPEEIAVDVSHLEIGDSIHVKDIILPPGIRTEHDPEGIAISVVPPGKEEEAVPTPVAEGAEPEVIKEKKAAAEEEGEEPKPKEKAGEGKKEKSAEGKE